MGETKQLRTKAAEEILRMLDGTIFTRHAFDCEFNVEDGALVSICFRDQRDFRFEIHQPSDWLGHRGWKTVESPGESFLSDEYDNIDSYEDCQERLEEWGRRLLEELAANRDHGAEIFEGLRQRLDRNLEELSDPELPFEGDEAESWRSRITTFVEQLDDLKEKLELNELEVQKLGSEMEKLKDNIESVPKKSWVRAAGSRVLTLFERGADAAAKSLAEGAVKGFLGP